MAKLDGVKTLDMVGGEITKVEYNGAIYEKVDEKVREGDLFQLLDGHYVIGGEVGAFYTTETYRNGDIVIPTSSTGNATYTQSRGWGAAFRKVSAPDAPTIESVNAKVDIVSEQVSILAERVDTLEGSKPVPTIKEGDRVKALTDGQFYDIEAGEIGEVTNIDAGLSDDDPYSIRVDIEDDHDYFRPQDLELVTEDDEEEIVEFKGRKYRNIGTVDAKDGDLVRFKRNCTRTTAGKLYEVINGKNYMDDGGFTRYTVDGWGGKEMREVFRLVEEAYAETITFEGEAYALVDRKAQPGDVVVFTESSVTWVKNGKPYGPVSKGIDFIDEDGDRVNVYRRYGAYGRAPENTKVYAPVESRVDL